MAFHLHSKLRPHGRTSHNFTAAGHHQNCITRERSIDAGMPVHRGRGLKLVLRIRRQLMFHRAVADDFCLVRQLPFCRHAELVIDAANLGPDLFQLPTCSGEVHSRRMHQHGFLMRLPQLFRNLIEAHRPTDGNVQSPALGHTRNRRIRFDRVFTV